MKVVVGVLGFILTVVCSRAELALGDPAPALSVKEWIKGGPIDITAGRGEKIYIVEFWAISWPPSVEAIPRLTELQKKYKDRGVVVVGLTSEAPSLVKLFIQKNGAKMDYAVGIDERDAAYKTYMEPFDQDGIPHAFIIDKEGRLVWHGHPLGSLDKAIEELLSGKFNLEGAKKYDRIGKLQKKYIETVNVAATRGQATELGATIIDELGKDAAGLNSFAWRILTDHRIEFRDATLALKAARLAYELGGSKDPAIVDTYARALFESGEKQAAIQQQKAAIGLAKDEGQRIEFESTLKKYQRLLKEGNRL